MHLVPPGTFHCNEEVKGLFMNGCKYNSLIYDSVTKFKPIPSWDSELHLML